LKRDSKTVLLLAESGSGKTTLTLGLMGRGWRAFTDDMTLVSTESLCIRPYQRCFHITKSSLVLLTSTPALEWPGRFGGFGRPVEWAAGARGATAIFLVERAVGQPSTLAPLTRAEAAGAILHASVRNQVALSTVAGVAARLASDAQVCSRLTNGELAEALDLIEQAGVDTSD
jgi:hypothetical protein